VPSRRSHFIQGLLDTHVFDSSFRSPSGTLTDASDGNYYGATSIGGNSENGNLYQLTPALGVTSLYSFDGNGTPNGSLVLGTDGNLYGSAYGTSQTGGGTLFLWNLSSGFRQLYAFPFVQNASSP
jgi:uncharacterized repeat protein (TIGR03803 family)